MRFARIGFVFISLFFLIPAFAYQCPPADKVRSCRGEQCYFPRLSGWKETIFYTDTGKPFSFQKRTEQGKQLSCYYTYINPHTHRLMPPALVLRTHL